jgi:hypothetical protein
MNVHSIDVKVYFTVEKDGTCVAASVSGPCFTVAAPTFEEAKGRAEEVLRFHAKRVAENTHAPFSADLTNRLTRTVRPFAPSHVEHYPAQHCVAA